MIRTQIQLDEEQYRRLRELSLKRSRSVAQLVREGVDHVLEQAERGRQWDRVWKAVGSCHDSAGASDVSVEHDRHLSRAFRS